MAHETCGIMPPYNGESWQLSSRRADDSCLRREGHHAVDHLFKLPDGRFISWEKDYSCGCLEDCTCFFYGEIPAEEANKKLVEDLNDH